MKKMCEKNDSHHTSIYTPQFIQKQYYQNTIFDYQLKSKQEKRQMN